MNVTAIGGSGAAPAAPAAKRARYEVLDGFRGFFLLFMMIIHVDEIVDTVLGKLNHHYFGWVEDAQGFVFISGFVVALVYGRGFDRGGFAAAVKSTFKRIRTIYKYQALLILFILALTFVPGASSDGVLRLYAAEPVLFTGASLLLLAASLHMGILPMYIYFMAFLPFVLRWLSRGLWFPVLLGSIALWLYGQTRLSQYGLDHVNANLAADGHAVRLGLFFNLFAWQLLFTVGAILGYQLNRGTLPVHLLRRPEARTAALIALGLIIALGLFDRLVYWSILPDDWITTFLVQERRKHLSALHVLAFLIDLFFVAWLLNAGRDDPWKPLRWLANAANAVVSHPKLIFLGQHSLQVFAWHIAVVYVLHVLLHDRPVSEFWGSVVLIGCVASLWIPARIHAWHQSRTRSA